MESSTAHTNESLCLDNGSEYTTQRFHDFFLSEGINKNFIPPHAP